MSALLALACSRGHVCDGGELAKAKTAAAERSAFDRLAARCHPLTVAAYDAAGAPLPFPDPAWMTKVRRVRIGAGGAPFEHTVIDGKNVGALLRE